jgi:Mor family transcriptional regulator
MRYINAGDILPAELVSLIQRYVSGTAVYIPSKTRRDWGSGTDAHAFFEQRNAKIRKDRQNGATVSELSEKFCLTYEAIKKIIYKK